MSFLPQKYVYIVKDKIMFKKIIYVLQIHLIEYSKWVTRYSEYDMIPQN